MTQDVGKKREVWTKKKTKAVDATSSSARLCMGMDRHNRYGTAARPGQVAVAPPKKKIGLLELLGGTMQAWPTAWPDALATVCCSLLLSWLVFFFSSLLSLVRRPAPLVVSGDRKCGTPAARLGAVGNASKQTEGTPATCNHGPFAQPPATARFPTASLAPPAEPPSTHHQPWRAGTGDRPGPDVGRLSLVGAGVIVRR